MSALIETKQGRRVDARIVGGSPGSVYLAGDNHERFTCAGTRSRTSTFLATS